MKLFISYVAADRDICKHLVDRLSNVHEVWYDHRLFAGQDWWQEILERIEWCDGFIYLLSPESIASQYCQKEYDFARKSGKHIFPVLVNSQTVIPREFGNIQYANLSENMEQIHILTDALTVAERKMTMGDTPPVIDQPTTGQPKPNPEDTLAKLSPDDLITAAADALDNGEFVKVVHLLQRANQQNLKGRRKRIVESMMREAGKELQIQAKREAARNEYQPIAELVKRERTRALGCEEFKAFRKEFPDYDPENLLALCQQAAQSGVTRTPLAQTDEIPGIDDSALATSQLRGTGTGVDELISAAAKALDAGEFKQAVQLLRRAEKQKLQGRRKRIVEQMLREAAKELKIQAAREAARSEYLPIAELIKRKRTRDLGCEEFEEFRKEFPNYDPQNLAKLCSDDPDDEEEEFPITYEDIPQVMFDTSPTPAAEIAEGIDTAPLSMSMLSDLDAAELTQLTLEILPPPFAWVEIPAGVVTLEGNGGTHDVAPFFIAKYPITNVQYVKFGEAGGYNDERWWDDGLWSIKLREEWSDEQFWQAAKWNRMDNPVVGVSWYEAIAYSRWLMDAIAQQLPATTLQDINITLPTEMQWQRAAQGDDGRQFPWGDLFDRNRCNTQEAMLGKTTPVMQYAGRGDSPYGVVDMAGNAWEWCLNIYDYPTDINIDTTENGRVMRGGSYMNSHSSARVAARNLSDPIGRFDNSLGFRLCCVMSFMGM